MKKLLAVLGLAAGLATACINTDQTLGEQFVATNQKYDFYSAEFDIPDVRMRPVDSLTAYSSRRITIGAVRDEDYGLYRRASAVTLVPVLKSVDFGKDPVFKRMRFRAAIDSVSVADESQLNILQNVNVYEMTEPLDSKKYFSRTPVKHGDRRITKGVPVTNGKDSLTFEFTEEFGKRFLEIKDSDLTDMKTYTKKFPGICFETDAPHGNGGRINIFDLQLKFNASYHYIEGNYAELGFTAEYDGVTKDTTFLFYFSPDQFYDVDSLIYNASSDLPQYCLNVCGHETREMSGRAAEKIYVEGGGGLKPVLSATEIREKLIAEISRHGNPEEAAINRASLSLPFEFPEDYKEMVSYPQILSPTCRIRTDSGNVSFASLTDSSDSSEDQGDVNRSLLEYGPDITYHTQSILKLKDLDKNGTPELIIAGMGTDDFSDRMVYDLYTLAGGRPVQLAQSQARNRWYLRSDSLLINEGSSGAAYSNVFLYAVKGSSLEARKGLLMDDGNCYYQNWHCDFEPQSGDRSITLDEYTAQWDNWKSVCYIPQLTRIA